MRLILVSLLGVASLSAQLNTLSAKEISDGWLSLFDGETLFGWTVEGGAKWRVEGGMIVAEASEASDESAGLEGQKRTLAGGAGQLETKGLYEAKPVDIGTGGVYFHQPARRVVGTDNQFYTKTIIAQGRHLSTWINGYPVADWNEPHPEGISPRNKQAHDPKTNLDFTNIRIRSLPR